MTLSLRSPLRLLFGAAIGLTLAGQAAEAAPTPTSGYAISTFGSAPTGASNPDSITVYGSDVFIGYANTSSKTGDPALGDSTIAEFSVTGSLVNQFSVLGHNDGLKIDPNTGLLWAIQNEDGNPSLVTINPTNGNSTTYSGAKFASSNSGGGYDDIVFQNGNTYISASNAQLDPNTDPAIVKASLSGSSFSFSPVLQGNAMPTGTSTPLNLTDADSLTTTPSGSLLLTDQTANELVTVTNPGPSQIVSSVPTTDNTGASIDVDDTVFPGGKAGRLLVSDTNADTVYAISGDLSGLAYSAAPDAGFVGALNLGTGVVTPIVTNFKAPKGMAFLPNGSVAVPEPGSLPLAVVGVLLFGCGVRRRRPLAQ